MRARFSLRPKTEQDANSRQIPKGRRILSGRGIKKDERGIVDGWCGKIFANPFPTRFEKPRPPVGNAPFGQTGALVTGSVDRALELVKAGI
jgi:hypothetical protein